MNFAKAFFTEFGQAQSDAWDHGYYDCIGDEMFPFGGLASVAAAKLFEEGAVGAVEHGAAEIAGAYYHFTDGRFTAWGRSSKVIILLVLGLISYSVAALAYKRHPGLFLAMVAILFVEAYWIVPHYNASHSPDDSTAASKHRRLVAGRREHACKGLSFGMPPHREKPVYPATPRLRMVLLSVGLLSLALGLTRPLRR